MAGILLIDKKLVVRYKITITITLYTVQYFLIKEIEEQV